MSELHVHELGDPAGEPLVCVHGLSGHGRRFVRLSHRLPGRRLICPDLRGHGRSTWDPPWHVEQHLEDLLAVLPEEPVDLLGFSYGGLLAQWIAAEHPERVRRLVLLDPATRLDPAVTRQLAEDERADVAYADEAEFVDQTLASDVLFQTPRDIVEEEAREHLERGEDGRLRERYCVPMAIVAWSEMTRPAPPRSGHPRFVVLAERSWVPPLPDADLVVPGGHSVLWESFEQTAAAVRSYLDSPAP